jgi:hypothetical protein
MLIVLLTNRKDYEPFLADVVFAFDGLGNFGIISHELARKKLATELTRLRQDFVGQAENTESK